MKRFLAAVSALILIFTTLLTGCTDPYVPTSDGEPTKEPRTESSSDPTVSSDSDYEWEDVPEEDDILIPADTETLEKAVAQVAWAMYNKNPFVQYECYSVSSQSAPAHENIGIHHYYAPEFASSDQTFYMQCNSFCVNCIYEACRYASYGGLYRPGTDIMNSQAPEGTQVYYKRNVTADIADQVIQEIREIIRPGDIIAAKGSSAHALLYIGDYKGDGVDYVAHCWGAGYDRPTGTRNPEPCGGIYIQPADELIFGHQEGQPSWDLHTHAASYVGIIRLFNAPDFASGITKASKTRIDYPGITVDKSLDRPQYRGIAKGEYVNVTISVTNNGDVPYENLRVKDYVPRGTVLADGETETTMTVQPGETETLSYRVKVIAEAGDTVTFGKGFVGNIRTREIVCNVSNAFLSDDEVRKLNLYAATVQPKNIAGDLSDIIKIYQEALGAEVVLPESLQDFLPACFYKDGGFIYRSETSEENRDYSAQVVYKQYGGLSASYLPVVMSRNLDLMTESYREGDVFVICGTDSRMKPTKIVLYLCLAPGKFLCLQSHSARIVDFDSTLALSFASNFYFVIRPTVFATGLGKTSGVMKAQVITTEDEFDAAVEAGAEEFVIAEDLTLEKKHVLGSKEFALTVRAGKTLTLQSSSINMNSLRLEEGAHIRSSGEGRVCLVSYAKETTVRLVKSLSGEAVTVYTDYYSSTNSYDCLTKTVEILNGREKLCAEDRTDYLLQNIREAASAVSEGWTIRLGISSTGIDDFVFPSGITIDLAGKSFAFRNLGKADLNIIDSVGNGAFIIHGTKQGEKLVFDCSVNAPGVKFVIGNTTYTGARSAIVTFTGNIVCKEFVLSQGSSYTTEEGGSVEFR